MVDSESKNDDVATTNSRDVNEEVDFGLLE